MAFRLGSKISRSFQLGFGKTTALPCFLKFSKAYANFAGFHLQFSDEGYDDSFTWFGLQDFEAIVGSHVIWIDADRFSGSDADALPRFLERISALREASTKAISCFISSKDEVIAKSWSDAVEVNVPGVFATSTWSGMEGLGKAVVDERMERIGGTYVSASCQAILAKDHSVRRFVTPSSSPTKLIVVDLDWTMYKGVLLEDGVPGAEITQEHDQLWLKLKEARDSGVLLGIASKNDPDLVAGFFEAYGARLPLALDDFMATEIHFGAKSESVGRLIEIARTTPHSTVFIDDNVGELAEVFSRFPELNLVVGGLGSVTPQWLMNGIAGIHWGTRDNNVETRNADIRARRKREGLANKSTLESISDPYSFLREMEITLTVQLDDSLDLPRIADMISRTNQFNSNLHRKSEDELFKLAAETSTHWVTVRLSDKFVESGVVFALIVERGKDHQLTACNLVMSCRAMGRGLEQLIVRESLRALETATGEPKILVPWIAGPRNKPVLDFLKDNSAGFLLGEESGTCVLSESEISVPNQLNEFVKVTHERRAQ